MGSSESYRRWYKHFFCSLGFVFARGARDIHHSSRWSVVSSLPKIVYPLAWDRRPKISLTRGRFTLLLSFFFLYHALLIYNIVGFGICILSEYKIMHVENKVIIIVDTQSDILLGNKQVYLAMWHHHIPPAFPLNPTLLGPKISF